jgi:hypothetical protein
MKMNTNIHLNCDNNIKMKKHTIINNNADKNILEIIDNFRRKKTLESVKHKFELELGEEEYKCANCLHHNYLLFSDECNKNIVICYFCAFPDHSHNDNHIKEQLEQSKIIVGYDLTCPCCDIKINKLQPLK